MDYLKGIVSDQKEESISIQRINLAHNSHADSPNEPNTRLNLYYDGVLKMLTALGVCCIYSRVHRRLDFIMEAITIVCNIGYLRMVSMIRKYHNHKLQTNPWHREEKTHNNHEIPGRQTNQSNQFSLSHQDFFKTSIGHKVTHNKTKNTYRIAQWEQQSTRNQQQQSHRIRMDSSLSHLGA